MITRDNFAFLKQLAENNNREWFNANKTTYEKYHLEMINFAQLVLDGLNKKDNIETPTGKKALHRIYRDVRFSKDKSPYKNHWSAGFKRATAQLRGGYYLHIEPGKVIVAGGFWGPNSADLKLIREGILADTNEYLKIINSKQFKNTFGEIWGDQLKTAPKGFDKEDPNINLIRYKQYILKKEFSDQEAFSESFTKEVIRTFEEMRPYFDFMSYVLTHNSNGEPLYS